MKRSNQLQPLSRHHHLGLNLSRHAKECADTTDEIAKHWHNLTAYIDDMQYHFQIEDNLIANALEPYRASQPEVASVLETLTGQHKRLQTLIDTGQKTASQSITTEQVRELGTLLYDHIRFEERELYPIVEEYLTEDELDAVYQASPDSIKRSDENR
ncbi:MULTISPECIES: hemerythrin domain-containing protein [Psychrobacter]|uniref:hemerythrin domain-containing protein n=1 Tax=Psychrobacter TaxID=497 RepID=UPI000C34A1DB|nr:MULTISPECIES: hemerythrin domain-containing protein [Psychrobacter]PKG35445.1 hypothetical protein CXF65_07765 [Psychrobacter sp. Sarcosine-3u-12]